MLIAMIKEMKTDMKNELQEIRKEQKEYRKEIAEIREENKRIAKENKELKENIHLINTKLNNIEKEKRRNNIVIQGIPIDTRDEEILKENMHTFITRNMNINVRIKNARKIGEKICLVELENGNDKRLIMRNKNKLKEIKEHKIYINDDMSKEQREIQRKIRIQARKEETEGKTTKIGNGKLIINGEEWTWNIGKDKLEKSKN